MPASRLELSWERASDWERIVGRRTRAGIVLPVLSGELQVRPVDVGSSVPPSVVCPGVVTDEGRLRLRATVEQIATLTSDTYEYRVGIVDAASTLRLTLLHGYLRLVDTVGDV